MAQKLLVLLLLVAVAPAAMALPNFVTFRTAGFECLYAVDGNPINSCPMLSSAPPRPHESPNFIFTRAAPRASSRKPELMFHTRRPSQRGPTLHSRV